MFRRNVFAKIRSEIAEGAREKKICVLSYDEIISPKLLSSLFAFVCAPEALSALFLFGARGGIHLPIYLFCAKAIGPVCMVLSIVAREDSR